MKAKQVSRFNPEDGDNRWHLQHELEDGTLVSTVEMPRNHPLVDLTSAFLGLTGVPTGPYETAVRVGREWVRRHQTAYSTQEEAEKGHWAKLKELGAEVPG